mmetsp:Transcript_2618/g.2908  ORF Transcript_2618/g.2908 Transcript_2618/m.2908 type:complete len:106 (+) Transcript_2618:50-367(+)|eukprot:CAMPEP_0197862402 /NCGR_PEP_ID=MMETSP1438-20131217/39136_1 /TAXON_ID=1461541 /ORGANISM="Pterosperma sp., Strain CCMP1384" /LENGTH=105 /DNA_ID=CAMNT_0043479951 /DNA_START=47 /DNA_END=364 /DNA_ORIENTATION=-
MDDDKTPQRDGIFEQANDAFRKNKLGVIGVVWGTGMVGNLTYNFSRNIPQSVKVIHARIFAQALTLTALVASAGAELLDPAPAPPPDAAAYNPAAHLKKHSSPSS